MGAGDPNSGPHSCVQALDSLMHFLPIVLAFGFVYPGIYAAPLCLLWFTSTSFEVTLMLTNMSKLQFCALVELPLCPLLIQKSLVWNHNQSKCGVTESQGLHHNTTPAPQAQSAGLEKIAPVRGAGSFHLPENSEATPVKSPQHGCLNRTWTKMMSVGMLTGKGACSQASPSHKELQVTKKSWGLERLHLREEHNYCLSKT